MGSAENIEEECQKSWCADLLAGRSLGRGGLSRRAGVIGALVADHVGLKRTIRSAGQVGRRAASRAFAGRGTTDLAWRFVALHPVALLAAGLASACVAEPFNAGIDEVVPTEAGLYDVHFVVPGPVTAGRQTATAEVWHEGERVPAELDLDAYMPAHVHGMGPNPIVTELETGLYDVSWTWPMAGAWQVMLTVDSVDGEDAAVFDVGVE